IDRTDWYLGETPLNVLLLGIAHEGVTFPLLWAVLPKKGCSDTAERIALLEEYLRWFGRSSIQFLCADREFVGLDWFAYLRREGIPFRIRVRANTKMTNGRGQSVQARRLFRRGRVGEAISLMGARRVLGQRLFVMGVRLARDEYVIVCAPEESAALLEDYARRGSRDAVRVPEDARLLPRSHPRHRHGATAEVAGGGSAGLLLGARHRRVAGSA